MTMRDYVLFACAFMVLVGVTMIVMLSVEQVRMRRELEYRDWFREGTESGLVEVVLDPSDHEVVQAVGERLAMLDRQDPVR